MQDHLKPFVIKDEEDFKGIGFSLIWERLDENTFKLICYHKGVFNILSEEFKTLMEYQPYSIVNTILNKELFNVIYKSDPLAKDKDLVYTDEIVFKFTELFEDENTICFYLSRLVDRFNWKVQTQEPGFEIWEDFII
ncbi:MAG: hypothetical protein EB127_02700 [Alphaproteobacteria bacterium]|nr:hypothetical protein [Alphaproteobacteria bacterium]